MDAVFGPFFKINKHASKACGTWPYQSKFERFCYFGFFLLTMFSILFALVAGMMQEFSSDLIIILETLVIVVFITSGTVNGIFLFLHQDPTKRLYERILRDWKKLTDETEREILKDHTKHGWQYTVLFILYISIDFIVSTTIVFVPRFRDADKPIDYAHTFPYYYYRMSLGEKYYHYQVLGHYSFAMIYVTFAYMAFSRTFITGVRHVCGLYEIARYRLEKVMKLSKSDSLDKIVDEKTIISGLIRTTRQHNDAINCIQLIEKFFNGPLLVVELMGIACMAIIVFDIKYHKNYFLQVIRLLFMLMQFVIYLLFFNAYGEQVLKSCNELLMTAYFIDWYKMPLKARKLLLIVMIRAGKCNRLTAGTLVTLSIENYAMILKTSWSFATVLLTAFSKKRD